jgi:transcriptional regulator with XRE-family HTH domain
MNEKLKPQQAVLRRRLSANIKRLRAIRNISQEGLGDLAGLHRTYISQVERMITNVSLDNIALLAAALEADAAVLLAKVEDESTTPTSGAEEAKKAQRGGSKNRGGRSK